MSDASRINRQRSGRSSKINSSQSPACVRTWHLKAQSSLASCGVSASALDVLVERRLLHVEDRLNIKRVELTHDVLTPVVKQSREERLTRERSELRRFLSRRPSRALQK